MGLNSLVVVQEPVHKYLRNMIMPAFTAEAIAALTPRMVSVIDKYLNRWADASEDVLAHEELRLLTFEFIIKVE
jgi:cytochrome P450